MKQVAIRLPDDVYEEFIKRARLLGRKITPYLQQILLDSAKGPAATDCILVQPNDELRWALVGIAKELNITPAGVLMMAADMALEALVDKAVAARESRQKANTKVGPKMSGQPKKAAPANPAGR
jgi:hypothetical protein